MSIEKQIASVEKLHGAERDQSTKRRDYDEWLKQRGPHCVRFILPTIPAKAD